MDSFYLFRPQGKKEEGEEEQISEEHDSNPILSLFDSLLLLLLLCANKNHSRFMAQDIKES